MNGRRARERRRAERPEPRRLVGPHDVLARMDEFGVEEPAFAELPDDVMAKVQDARIRATQPLVPITDSSVLVTFDAEGEIEMLDGGAMLIDPALDPRSVFAWNISQMRSLLSIPAHGRCRHVNAAGIPHAITVRAFAAPGFASWRCLECIAAHPAVPRQLHPDTCDLCGAETSVFRAQRYPLGAVIVHTDVCPRCASFLHNSPAVEHVDRGAVLSASV